MDELDKDIFEELFGIIENAFLQDEADGILLAAASAPPELYALEPVAHYHGAVYYRLTNNSEPISCRICGSSDLWQLYQHPDGHHGAYYCPHRLRRCPVVAMDSISINTVRPPLWRGAGLTLEHFDAQVSYRPGQDDYPGDPDMGGPIEKDYR